MSDVVQIDYSAMAAIRSQLAQLRETQVNLESTMRNAYEPLQAGDWEGKGAGAFFKVMEGSIFPSLKRLQLALTSANEVSTAIVQIFQNAEQEAAQLFKGSDDFVDVASGSAKARNLGDPTDPPIGLGEKIAKAVQEMVDQVNNIINRDAHNKEIQDAINSGDKQKAIDLAIKYYNIDTTAAKSILYDSTVSGEGETTKSGKITIGDSAFTSPQILATTLIHEMRHAEQAKDRWYPGPQGINLNEIEAYDLELQRAEFTGISQADIEEIKRRRKSYYDELSPEIQKLADQGIYTLPPGKEHL